MFKTDEGSRWEAMCSSRVDLAEERSIASSMGKPSFCFIVLEKDSLIYDLMSQLLLNGTGKVADYSDLHLGASFWVKWKCALWVQNCVLEQTPREIFSKMHFCDFNWHKIIDLTCPRHMSHCTLKHTANWRKKCWKFSSSIWENFLYFQPFVSSYFFSETNIKIWY